MSLDLKYRPKTLDEVAGNEETIKAIRAHFTQENKDLISHCHLISGISGGGKTTLARAIATELLHADPKFGIREINTADNRGIDTAREVIEQMRRFPLKGKSLCIIVDEAHGMTADAKRAFLKPTEEPPAHVYFFFCTTNVSQFLKGDEGKAIGTRCTTWKVEPLNTRQMGKLITKICEQENFNLDEQVFGRLVESANGSARDAIKKLESLMGIPGDVKGQLKLLNDAAPEEEPNTLELCRLLTNSRVNWSDVNKVLAKMKGFADAETVRRSVLGYCTSILLKKDDAHVAHVLEEFAVDTYATGFPGLVLAAYRAIK